MCVTHSTDITAVILMQTEFNDILKTFPPAPKMVEEYLSSHSFADSFTSKALDEYRYYLEHGEHRDIKFWSDRDSWPIDSKTP